MKAFIYARVSSKEQAEEGFSIPAQVELLQAYAKKHGFIVVDVYSEAETAKQSGRAEFQKMLKAFKLKNAPSILLVEKTDRLYRNWKDYVQIEDLMKEHGLEIHLVKEGETLSDKSTSHTKFIHGIKVLMAKNYSDNLREETIKGQTQKVKEGGWITVAPYGYKNQDKGIVPDGQKALFVKTAYQLYSQGIYSLTACASELVRLGHHHHPQRPKISAQLLQKMLTNPVYAGLVRYKDNLYQGKHTPLITMELFNQTQEALGLKCKNKSKSEKVFAYRGLITCGHCGNYLIGDAKKGGKYVYYRCNKVNSDCPQGYISETKLNQCIQDVLSSLQMPSKLKDWIKATVQESLATHEATIKDDYAIASREISRISTNLKQAYQDRLDGIITGEQFTAYQSEQTTRRIALEEKLSQLGKADINHYELLEQLIELPESLSQSWYKANDVQKGSILKLMTSNFFVKDENISLVLNPLFETMRILPKKTSGGTPLMIIELIKRNASLIKATHAALAA